MPANASSQALACRFHTDTGSVERLLRTIRVRGFGIDNMTINLQDGMYTAYLTLNGDKSMQNLLKQLAKLVDVVEVTATTNDTGKLFEVNQCGFE